MNYDLLLPVRKALHVSPPRIHVDLDGVLADFELLLFLKYGVRVHDCEDDEMWAYVNKYDAEAEWFSDLPLMPGARELWEYIAPYNPHILTATGRAGERAADQKRRWVERNFGVVGDRVVAVRKSEMKAEYVTEGAILIDDNLPRSITSWRAAGGIGIHHVNTRMSIAELKARGL